MASHRCPACSSSSLDYAEDALSLACTRCGTLLDSTQIVIDYSQHTLEGYSTGKNMNTEYGETVLRRSTGQSMQASWNAGTRRSCRRAERHNLICILIRLHGHSSEALIKRAQWLFDSAHERAHFSWGSVCAETVAGAAVAVALREGGFCEGFGKTAAYLHQPPIMLTRTYSRLKRLLALSLAPADPHVYLSPLAVYLQRMLSPSSQPLSLSRKTCEHISLPCYIPVLNFATNLLRLITSTELIVGRYSAPIACAAMLLSLEAEKQKSIPGIESVAELLAFHLGTRASTVMDRYRDMGSMIDLLRGRLAWATVDPAMAKRPTKRDDRAAWMRDVVVLGHMLWLQPTETVVRSKEHQPGRYDAPSEEDEREDDEAEGAYAWENLSEEDEGFEYSSGSAMLTGNPPAPSTSVQISGKRIQGEVATSTLSPFLRRRRRACPTTAEESVLPSALSLFAPSSSDGRLTASGFRTRSLLLKSHVPPSEFQSRLTLAKGGRLTRLSLERGGEEAVKDEDLFEDGEMEGYLRDEEEIEVLKAEVMRSGRWDQPAILLSKKRCTGERTRKRMEVKRALSLGLGFDGESILDDGGDDDDLKDWDEGDAKEIEPLAWGLSLGFDSRMEGFQR